jgi:iron complex transport system permease protein
MRTEATVLAGCLLLGAGLLALGSAVGSAGLEPLVWSDPVVHAIRLPRSLGAWLTGALLGLAGALAQGLFRNPLADPYLLGASSGAGLGVALALMFGLTLTPAAFVGALLAVGLTLVLARGVEHSLRMLLAGVIVGVVLSAASSLVTLIRPEVLRSMQSFLLGATGLLDWRAVQLLALLAALCLGAALAGARALDALVLGESTAATLGLPLKQLRFALIAVLALATAGAVSQAGLIGFVGLVAPHLVRARLRCGHGWLLLLSAVAGGGLLLAADVLARWCLAPAELPVGVVTTLLGGGYLLWLMFRRGPA